MLLTAGVPKVYAQCTGTCPVIAGVNINSCVGVITINVTGNGPFTYDWRDSGGTQVSTSFIANGLTADNYTVTVTDIDGDTETATYTVTNPPNLSGTAVVNDVTCRGDSDAQVVVTMSNGNPDYEWELFNGGGASIGTGTAPPFSNTITLGGLGVDNYNLVVTDANGCTGVVPFSVTQPVDFLGFSIGASTDATCFNSTDGSVSATGTGGWGNYIYQWERVSDGAVVGTTSTVTGLAPGDYRLVITDRNGTGCTITTPVQTVGSPPEIIPSASITSASCNGTSTGSINLSVSGGVGPYTYSWSNGATTQDISGLAAGSYTVTITDNAGCTDVSSYNVGEPAVLTINPSVTDVACFGDATGVIESNVSGGTAPYSYSWSTGATSADISSLAAGTYNLTVTDNNGCSTTINNITVAQPAAALSKLSDSQTNPSCASYNDGEVTITMQGGTGPYSYSWSNGDNTATASNLTAGMHTVTVTDNNGCTYFETFTLTDPPSIVVTPATTEPSCNGAADGEITVSASNGTAPYVYNWNTGDSGPTINGLVAGTYTVTVTDQNGAGCTVVETITLGQPSVLNDNATVNDISCNGANDGSISLAVTGGTGPYTYNWSNGATTNNISGLSAGPYSVTIEDDNGCSIVRNFTIVDPPAIGVSHTQVDILCKGALTGEIDITPSGGTAPYTYSWSNGSTAQDLVNVAAGSYTVTVTDDEGCSVGLTVTLTEPATVMNLSGVETDGTCAGSNNGSINLTVSGGTGPYTYLWNTGATSEDISGLAPGIYSVSVEDSGGCIKSIDFTISEPSPISVSETLTNVTCNGAADGTISLSVGGGTGPYTYSWADDISIVTKDRTGLGPGNYTLTVEDASGCLYVESFNITEPAILSSTATQLNVSCFGESTGSINLSISGGTTPYTFSWSNGALTEDLSNIPAGNYSVTITDAKGCTDTQSFTIIQPASALSVSSSVSQITCNGAADGIINLTVSGGSAPYSFNWSHGSTLEDLSNLSAGTYTVTVTDNNGCTFTDSFTITDPPVLTLNEVVTDIDCNGAANGEIDITVGGGEGPYTFAWSNGATTEDVSNLGPGSYSVTVTDARGCTINDSYTISQPTALGFSYTSVDVSCFGFSDGSIDITVTGGTAPYDYSWSGGEITEDIGSLAAGNYTVTVTDFNGCTINQTITIAQPVAPLSDTGVANDISCFGGSDGSIQLNPTGGTAPYTYSWSNGATTKDISGLTDGSYQVTITDDKGCSITETFTINMPPAMLASGTQTNILCNGDATGSIDLTVSGGTAPYSYAWSNGATSQDLTNIVAGNYQVTISDASGCSLVRNFTITQPLALLIGENVEDVSCFGVSDGFIDLSVSGGIAPYTYAWSNGATTQDLFNISGGNYSVTITDGNGCATTRNYTIAEPTSALSVSGTVIDENCFGDNQGAINLTVTGGTAPYTYNWNHGPLSKDVAGLGRGAYQVTVTDNNGCSVTTNYTVSGPSALQLSAIPTQIDCNGAANGALDATVTGGTAPYSYNWSNGSVVEDISSLAPGNYSLLVTDANGCTTSGSWTITQPLAITKSQVTTNVSCFGAADGAIDLTVSGGVSPYTYSWSNGATSQDISGLSGGSYTVTITDANGCTSSDTYVVTEPAAALSVNGTVTDESCFGDNLGSVSLTVSGGTGPYSYSWNHGPNTKDVAGLGRGNYQVTVTDANGCSVTTNYTVSGPSALQLSAVPTQITCNGAANGALNVTTSGGTGPYTYSWSNGAATEDISALAPGTYTLTVTDANGCSQSGSWVISQPLAVSVSQNITNVSCFGAADGAIDISVSGGIAPYTYAWSNGASTQDITGLSGGNYSVTITDANGCVATRNYSITEPSAALSVTGVVTDETCFGDNQGAIALTVSGGTAPYTYSWNQGSTNKDISALSQGIYQVTITDANGCSIQSDFTVSGPTALTATGSVTQISCNGAANGAIDIEVSGGTLPYTFAWGHGDTSEDLSSLSPGNYSVIITDGNGCSVSKSYTITQPAALGISYSATNVSCFGAGDGAISVTVAGGTLPYSYSWSNGSTSKDISALSGGNYDLTVTDGKGCSITQTITVTEPAAPLTLAAIVTDESCFGDNQGAIDLTASGGTAPYSYSWNNGSSSQDILGLGRGNYQVTVTDKNGCSATAIYSLSGPDVLTVSGVVSPVSCNGANDGVLDITVVGGTAPYTYSWSNGATSEDIASLGPGTYSLAVTDANGCIANRTWTISQPLPLTINYLKEDVSCFGADDGSVDLTVSGGTLPYTYSWNNGATTRDLSGLAGGTYEVTVTDARGCQLSTQVLVNAPIAPLTAAPTITDAFCNGQPTGKIQLAVTGGTAPFNYSWSNGSNQRDLLNVFAGNYSVTIIDAKGCTIVENYTIEEPDALDVSFEVTNSSCLGDTDGAVSVTPNGGTAPFSYVWSNGSTSKDLVNIAGGTYNLTITDANGCSITRSVEVGDSKDLNVDIQKMDVFCKGEATGQIYLDITGGSGNYDISWSNGATTPDLTDITAGVYSAIITDSNGCGTSISVVISEPSEALSVQLTGYNDLLCYGDKSGTIRAVPQGGVAPYTYLWSNGARTNQISGLGAGTYIVSVTDANGCLVQAQATIGQPDKPITISSQGKFNLNCKGDNDGRIVIDVEGGTGLYEFLWSTGATTSSISNLSVGDYTVRVKDANGCVQERIFTMSEPDELTIEDALVNESQCYDDRNGSIELNIRGGVEPYSYQWSTGATTKNIIGITSGTYSVLVTDANGCQVQGNYSLAEPALFKIDPQMQDISCIGANDASISLNIEGGIEPVAIRWSNGASTETITDLGPGEYNVLVTDDKGCTIQQTFNIIEPLALKLDAYIEEAARCNDPHSGRVNVIVTGGTEPYTYRWSNGATTSEIVDVLPGTYVVRVRDKYNCEVQGTYTVLQPEPLQIGLSTAPYIDCENRIAGTLVTADVKGGVGNYSYQWSKGNSVNNELLMTEPGRLTVEVYDDRGCFQQNSISIDIPELGLADFNYTAESIDLTGDLSAKDPVSFFDLSIGEVVDWYWDFGDGFDSDEIDPIHTYDSPGNYTVRLVVTDRTGCETEKITNLEITEGYRVIIPNAFTPNGDGNNDFFRPRMLGLVKAQLIIYNTWGEVIFSTDDIETKGWDGKIKGRAAENGNYVYKIIGLSFNGLNVEREGIFALIN